MFHLTVAYGKAIVHEVPPHAFHYWAVLQIIYFRHCLSKDRPISCLVSSNLQ